MEEYFEYLDNLRLSGVTNMFGAGPYLMEEFNLPKDEAYNVLKGWMYSFNERHTEENNAN